MNTNTIRAAIAAVGIGLAGVATAPVAAADADTADEVAYIRALDHEGIYYSSEDAAIATGYSICRAFAAGATFERVIITGVSAAGGTYDAGEVGYITGVAVGAFCPQYAYVITGAANRWAS